MADETGEPEVDAEQGSFDGIEAPAPETDIKAPAPETDTKTPPDWSKRVEEWGGESSIEEALRLQQALSSKEGVEALFEEAARWLGYSDKLDAIRNPQPEAKAEPASDGEDLITKAEARQMAEEMLREQALKPWEEQQRKAQEDTTRRAVNRELEGLKISDPVQARIILDLADRHITPEAYNDPDAVAAAIQKGYVDYRQAVDAEAKRYLSEKQAKHEAAPEPLKGGTSPGGESDDEPLTLKEAKARVRAKMGLRSA